MSDFYSAPWTKQQLSYAANSHASYLFRLRNIQASKAPARKNPRGQSQSATNSLEFGYCWKSFSDQLDMQDRDLGQ